MNFEAAFSDVRPVLLGLALKFTRNRDEAEDLVQETALKAFRFQDKYDPSQPFRNWCMRIMQNIRLDNVRRAKRRVQTDSIEDFVEGLSLDIPDDARCFTDYVDGSVVADNLLSLMDRVTPLGKSAITLLAQGCSYREVADRTGVSYQAVGARVCRSRRLLMPLLN